METGQIKELLVATSALLFTIFCIISIVGAYVVSTYKTSLLNDRLKESIATNEKAISILSDWYNKLSQQKTLVVIKDKESGIVELKSLNTTPEEELRK